MRAELLIFGAVAAFITIGFLALPVPSGDGGRQDGEPSPLPLLGRAPELAGTGGWVNSEPLTLAGLRGKVVLLDFWTYSCINCIRTLPFLAAWHEKYAASGLVILGVHTPEFAFEKEYENVKAAVERFGIPYAVVQDNDYATWRAYRNNFWPRKYLIDAEGNIRYDHIGEGAYQETEAAIQSLLKEITFTVPPAAAAPPDDGRQIGTPELYLGYAFIRSPLGNEEGLQPEMTTTYHSAPVAVPHTVYLAGEWTSKEDRAIAGKDARLSLIYFARDVNIVAGGEATVAVSLDGAPLPAASAGKDAAADGTVTVSDTRLYSVVSSPTAGQHLLELTASPGLELYTFTFG